MAIQGTGDKKQRRCYGDLKYSWVPLPSEIRMAGMGVGRVAGMVIYQYNNRTLSFIHHFSILGETELHLKEGWAFVPRAHSSFPPPPQKSLDHRKPPLFPRKSPGIPSLPEVPRHLPGTPSTPFSPPEVPWRISPVAFPP